ncbi:MAG TPA: GHKL domain-containing protein, partial [Lachnospiraceae bacterium]|nr:GHKL domain-containing protein [Lachnospiraceae bacterium]
IYIAEARERCEQTKAFRHDIKNHLAVLKGLLDSGKPEEIKADVSLLLPGSCGIDDFDLCVI